MQEERSEVRGTWKQHKKEKLFNSEAFRNSCSEEGAMRSGGDRAPNVTISYIRPPFSSLSFYLAGLSLR